jgi:hypothetical protein
MLAAHLPPLANAIGEAWVNELVNSLRTDDRDVVGAWPGTMSEARMRVLAALHVKLDLDDLAQLARIANLAARKSWDQRSERDPEP